MKLMCNWAQVGSIQTGNRCIFTGANAPKQIPLHLYAPSQHTIAVNLLALDFR